MEPTPSAWKDELFQGIKAELPILLAVAPFGMIYGALALSAGLPAGVAQAMSSIVFAGSAQLLSIKLFGGGAPTLVIILTILVVNLRHALYSASVAPYLKKLSPVWKGFLAYLLTDEAYAVTIIHYRQDGTEYNRNWFFLGAGLTLWLTWQASTAFGIFLGSQVPASWSLDFTLALTFIALVVPVLKDRPSIFAALSAGVVSILTFTWPYKLGLVIAALVGILVGLWGESR